MRVAPALAIVGTLRQPRPVPTNRVRPKTSLHRARAFRGHVITAATVARIRLALHRIHRPGVAMLSASQRATALTGPSLTPAFDLHQPDHELPSDMAA